jgi:hypothetical protein
MRIKLHIKPTDLKFVIHVQNDEDIKALLSRLQTELSMKLDHLELDSFLLLPSGLCGNLLREDDIVTAGIKILFNRPSRKQEETKIDIDIKQQRKRYCSRR